MSDFSNRLGHDNFVWWIGVVEDRFDPLNLGRCRVRIFGSHTDNLQEIPTSDLPWATPLYPVNSANSFGTPMEGDYVFGFFLDGMSSQSPAMMGVFPGIPQNEAPADVGFSPKAKYIVNTSTTTGNVVTQETDVKPVVDPSTPAMKLVQPGKPTTPALAITLTGTSVEKSNNNRAHVCDIAHALKFGAAIEKLGQFLDFLKTRAGIELASDGAAGSPLASQVLETIKVIRGYVKLIQDGLTFINQTVLEIASYLKYVKQMIEWIVSLPAALLNMLKQCLVELQVALTGALNFSDPTGIVGEISGLVGDVLKVTQTAQTVAVNTQSTISTAQVLTNPKTYGKA